MASTVNSTGYHSGPSVNSSAPSEQTYTPKGTNADLSYDSYAYLQGAQKALEGFSLSQQQQILQQPIFGVPIIDATSWAQQQHQYQQYGYE